MGSLRKRGEVWWIRYYRNGRRYEESSHSKKETEARTLLKLREGDVAKGVPVTPAIGRLRFEEAAADVINDYRINGKSSIEDLERRVQKHLTPFFGPGRRMVTISTADVRAFVAQRKAAAEVIVRAHERPRKDGTMRRIPERRRKIAGASNAEINRELSILKRMFTLAMQAGKLLAAPHIPMIEERNVRTGFFERDQFEEVRRHLPDELRPIATFAYLTGWRSSEILTLEWRQVDLQAGTVRLDPGSTKNREGRLLPFGDVLTELRDLLEEQWRRKKAAEQAREAVVARVFHRAGKPIADFRGAWKAACEAAGCPQRIVHDLRRTAVRNYVRAGVPERVAMQLTGHKTRSVFDRYDIVNEADLRSGIAKLAALDAGTAAGTVGKSPQVRRIRTRR